MSRILRILWKVLTLDILHYYCTTVSLVCQGLLVILGSLTAPHPLRKQSAVLMTQPILPGVATALHTPTATGPPRMDTRHALNEPGHRVRAACTCTRAHLCRTPRRCC